MAKIFKNLPRPGEPTVLKPTSKRDFFDLSDEGETVETPAKSNNNLRNTDNTDNAGNTSNIIVAELKRTVAIPDSCTG